MDILPLLCLVSAAFTGLTKGVGVLQDSQIAAVGQTVMFTTTLTPPEKTFLTVGWTFDGRNIISFSGTNTTGPQYEGRITLFMSTGSLELRNVALNDSGEYSVSIFPFGEAQKTGSTILNVSAPVSDVMATASNTDLVEFNSSVSLSCSASGSWLSFLWLNGSSEVIESDRVQLTDGGANLTIVNVTRYDQGPFKCQVSNPVSNGTSEPINFNISYGPDNVNLQKSPSQDYYAEGSDITLTCSAESRPNAQFTWHLNGSLQSDTGRQFNLTTIQESQSGNYSCQAFNSKTLRYESSSPAVISVLKKISGASITSSTKLPIESNSFNLTCDAAGSVLTRKWMKDGKDLITTDEIILYDNNRVLYFNSLNKLDSGEYSCTLSNPFSNEKAKYFMDVIYGPENVQIKHPSEIFVNENLSLTCSAESTPSATYTWKVNGTVKIHNSTVFSKPNIQLSDGGIYTCEAMNYITKKTSSADYELSVKALSDKTSGCSGGCIAGIVIAVLVVLAAAGGGGYYFYHKRMNTTTAARTGGEGQENTAFSGSPELDYADIQFFQNKDGGIVQLGSQNETSEYAQVRVNNSGQGPSSPPTYDDHLQRQKRLAPQPDATSAEVYAQVSKK